MCAISNVPQRIQIKQFKVITLRTVTSALYFHDNLTAKYLSTDNATTVSIDILVFGVRNNRRNIIDFFSLITTCNAVHVY